MDLKYSVEDIEKIVGYTSWTAQKKVDTLLHINSTLFSNLGLDSSNQERLASAQVSKKIYKAIKIVNPVLGKSLLLDIDS